LETHFNLRGGNMSLVPLPFRGPRGPESREGQGVLARSESGSLQRVSSFPSQIWSLRSTKVVEVSVHPLGERLKGKDFFLIRLHLEDESQPINLPRPTGTASFFEVEVEEKELQLFSRLTGRYIRINYLTWEENERNQNLSQEILELQEEVQELKRRNRALNDQLTFLVTSQRQLDS
jgi:hypothetical protein